MNLNGSKPTAAPPSPSSVRSPTSTSARAGGAVRPRCVHQRRLLAQRDRGGQHRAPLHRHRPARPRADPNHRGVGPVTDRPGAGARGAVRCRSTSGRSTSSPTTPAGPSPRSSPPRTRTGCAASRSPTATPKATSRPRTSPRSSSSPAKVGSPTVVKQLATDFGLARSDAGFGSGYERPRRALRRGAPRLPGAARRDRSARHGARALRRPDRTGTAARRRTAAEGTR